jgi:hypothetical protein
MHSKKMSKTTIMEDVVKTENVMFFIDIHGHSINDGIFMYGCKGTCAEENLDIKEVPYLLAGDLVHKAMEKLIKSKRTNLSCDACLINQ